MILPPNVVRSLEPPKYLQGISGEGLVAKFNACGLLTDVNVWTFHKNRYTTEKKKENIDAPL